MDCNLPVHEISSARILEWVTNSIYKGSSCPRDETCISCIAGRFYTSEPPGRPTKHLWLCKILVFTQCLPTTETFDSVQSLSHVQLFVTPWTTAHQASLSITNSQSYSNSSPLVGDAIQPSFPLPSPSSPAFNLSQRQCLPMSHFFASGNQSIGVSASASVFPINVQGWPDSDG